jgi:hypothetical protein
MSYNNNFVNNTNNTNQYINCDIENIIPSIPINNNHNSINQSNMIPPTTEEQESFMHLLYDLIHIGISFSSLEFRVDNYQQKYDLNFLLNMRMKNERYSNSYDYPLAKVVCQDCGFGNTIDDFFATKLKTIKYLISKGANHTLLSEKYKGGDIDYDYLLEREIINLEIYEYLMNL